jgi:hypothetical protein
MRLIRTSLLHLYVDSETPERVWGNLRPLEEPESYPFNNPVEFEALLGRLVSQWSATLAAPPGTDTRQAK